MSEKLKLYRAEYGTEPYLRGVEWFYRIVGLKLP